MTDDFNIKEPHEYVSNKIQALCSVISEHHPEHKSTLIEYAIRELMNWGGSTYYESIGIAQEAILSYRDAFKEMCAEDCCDECAEDSDEEIK